MIEQLIFDWGGTIMIDYAFPGPMYLWDRVDWVPGAEEALRRLTTRYPLCIATNAPHSGTLEMIKALERIGAKQYFTAFFSSKELAFGKPDPRFFETIAGKLGAVPSACVMIGDRYAKDIEGARSAGMKTIFYNEKKLLGPFPAADMVITDMGHLPEAVQMIA